MEEFFTKLFCVFLILTPTFLLISGLGLSLAFIIKSFGIEPVPIRWIWTILSFDIILLGTWLFFMFTMAKAMN
jgi:hypothetical protein